MKQSPWRDKWRALSDSRRARNAAAGITSETMTTDLHGASGAIITKRGVRTDLSLKEMKMKSQIYDWKKLGEAWENSQLGMGFEKSSTEANWKSLNFYELELRALAQTLSPSPITPQKEDSLAYKSVTTEVKGQVVPNTSIGEVQSTLSPSTTTTPTTDEW